MYCREIKDNGKEKKEIQKTFFKKTCKNRKGIKEL